MNFDLKHLMTEATRLTRAGDLQAATAAIQAALRGLEPVQPTTRETGGAIDVEARQVPEGSPAGIVDDAPGAYDEVSVPGRFIAGSFADAASRRDYKLYIPPEAGRGPLPLVVMLHGCTQDPDDFAAGTAMNAAALAHGFYVLYPAQSRQANPQGCWNWFKHSHQKRGRGEPALLAGMTQSVMAQHAIDPQRVYVAGLSAGGAMAAILGDAYPDLYAAVGVHSGLAAGVASDLPAALMAMKKGGALQSRASSGMPTIVFHGDADATVHASNGEQVIAASVGNTTTVEVQRLNANGARAATRRLHRSADGRVVAEHWTVHGAPHAWAGGSTKGSYTDVRGPDASAEMLRFFFEHSRKPMH
ncbi:extracellular catalytic domain type 1 short-chain-length polyhydroxyalkanoate depolymerase [Variovorax sp. RA8]|uniref:extracellular catalytic domain type 1 short-chain-length polyhydroxyalkanoate depolymerase n=1 Tax=Variovorax sp. (strain JCM 16519 / RA8) TaxID=662548 RepID=UPI00131709BD|nr:PHB depolymerase family esterase [Variovorax sp. RA8]VTU13558.1 esterase, PHB depolymerase family [Variovorax sp. RA8]